MHRGASSYGRTCVVLGHLDASMARRRCRLSTLSPPELTPTPQQARCECIEWLPALCVLRHRQQVPKPLLVVCGCRSAHCRFVIYTCLVCLRAAAVSAGTVLAECSLDPARSNLVLQ
jgi:hypothetical protein